MVNYVEILSNLKHYSNMSDLFVFMFILSIVGCFSSIVVTITHLSDKHATIKGKIMSKLFVVLTFIISYYSFIKFNYYDRLIEEYPYKFAVKYNINICDVYKYLAIEKGGKWYERYFNNCVINKEVK